MRREVELPTQLNAVRGRQRQLLSEIYARGGVTVDELQRSIPDAPSNTAIRTLLGRLTARGYVTKRRALRSGREVIYVPGISNADAKLSALKHIADEFFRGSRKSAVRELVRLAEARVQAEQDARV